MRKEEVGLPGWIYSTSQRDSCRRSFLRGTMRSGFNSSNCEKFKLTGRAEQKETLCPHPDLRARQQGIAAAATSAATRLRGIPLDLPLPLRFTLPCLAPVLDRRLPIYTGLGSSRLTLPSRFRLATSLLS
ncbi:uncharacterized protein LOC141573150 isoform X2 [Rhinolophus sinicus]|uniref:uncharacterized protein LOC141573150 isoform X2 n=1 Tax=Rhinolophus sinicus TaxID=89399 RepID=UPI003D7AA083